MSAASEARRERQLVDSGVWAERLVWQTRMLELTEQLTNEGHVRIASRIFKVIDRTANEARR
jgi:hypothetical protein